MSGLLFVVISAWHLTIWQERYAKPNNRNILSYLLIHFSPISLEGIGIFRIFAAGLPQKKQEMEVEQNKTSRTEQKRA